MSFMQPQVYKTDYLEIDGPMGTEILPCDVADYHPTEEDGDGKVKDAPEALLDYLENGRVFTIERKHGWIGRYSAPGYMDCTSWTSGESEADVRAELERMYGDEDPEEYEIAETVDGRFMVLVNGTQWGPPGSKPDASGAYADTWPTESEAREEYEAAIEE